MNPLFAIVAVSVLGVDVGWKPLDEGGVEYIIQIPPDEVDRIVKFDDLVSNLPKNLDIRRYRITIGTEKLPKISAKKSTSEKPIPEKAASKESAAPKKELIAEGTIPATAQEPVKTERPSSEDSITEEPAPDESAEEAEAFAEPTEGPIFPPTETTVKKPVTGRFEEHDPAPQDEEPPARRDDRRPASGKPDLLFQTGASHVGQSHADETEERESTRSSGKHTVFDLNAAGDGGRKEELSPPSRETRSSEGLIAASNGQETTWLVTIFFILLLSAALNMYLFWIAHEARARYQVLLEKYRESSEPVVDVV